MSESKVQIFLLYFDGARREDTLCSYLALSNAITPKFHVCLIIFFFTLQAKLAKTCKRRLLLFKCGQTFENYFEFHGKF